MTSEQIFSHKCLRSVIQLGIVLYVFPVGLYVVYFTYTNTVSLVEGSIRERV